MRILVTGCNGQLGREMQRVLEDRIPGSAIYTSSDTLDITDQAAVDKFFAENDLTHVVNCCAYTDVDNAEEEKALCTKLNVDALRNIAHAASTYGVKVIHVSTSSVFDGKSHRPYNECDKVNPISHYGNTKRRGETALIALAPDSIIVRSAWLYSPYGDNFVKDIITAATSRRKLRIVSDHIGSPTSASDLAEAILAILSSHQWVPGIYHYSSSGVASWFDFAHAVCRLAGIPDADIKPISSSDAPTAAARPPYNVLDTAKILATYDVTSHYWLDSLKVCIDRMLHNTDL